MAKDYRLTVQVMLKKFTISRVLITSKKDGGVSVEGWVQGEQPYKRELVALAMAYAGHLLSDGDDILMGKFEAVISHIDPAAKFEEQRELPSASKTAHPDEDLPF